MSQQSEKDPIVEFFIKDAKASVFEVHVEFTPRVCRQIPLAGMVRARLLDFYDGYFMIISHNNPLCLLAPQDISALILLMYLEVIKKTN